MAGTRNTRRVLMIGAELKESEKLYSSTSITDYFIKVKDTAYKHRLEEKKFLDSNDRYKHLTRYRSEIPTVPKDGNDSWKQRGRDRDNNRDRDHNRDRDNNRDRDYNRDRRNPNRDRYQDKDRNLDRERIPDKERYMEKEKIPDGRDPGKEGLEDKERIPDKEKDIVQNKSVDPDKKIPKKPRREGDRDGDRTPYQPGRRGTPGPSFTPRDQSSLSTRIIRGTDDDRYGLCNGCGLDHRNPRVMTDRGLDHSGCRFFLRKHEHYNYENVTWVASRQGRIFAAAGLKSLVPHLIIDKDGIVVDRVSGVPYKKRPAADSETGTP